MIPSAPPNPSGAATVEARRGKIAAGLCPSAHGSEVDLVLWWLVRVDVRDAGGHAYDDACLECNHKHIGRIGDECANKLRGNRVVEDILINTLEE